MDTEITISKNGKFQKRKTGQKGSCNGKTTGEKLHYPCPMAIGLEMDGHRAEDEWLFVGESDGYPSGVEWPSV